MFISRKLQRVAMAPKSGFLSATHMANKWQPSAYLLPTPSFYRLTQIQNRSFAGRYSNDHDFEGDSNNSNNN